MMGDHAPHGGSDTASASGRCSVQTVAVEVFVRNIGGLSQGGPAQANGAGHGEAAPWDTGGGFV